MKHILQLFILLGLFFNNVVADDFKTMIKISLKKDEQKKFLVKYGTTQKLFTFRWTLFVNDGLVVLRSYDTKVAQNILYVNDRNQSFRLLLKTRGSDFYKVPYIIVKFKDFDLKNNKANFELYLWDDKDKIKLKELKNG